MLYTDKIHIACVELIFRVFAFLLNFHRKQLSSPKKDVPLYKKRNLDFTDYAHREAVNRLKFLLAESYTPCSSRPRRGSFCHKHDDSDDTDNVSVRFLFI